MVIELEPPESRVVADQVSHHLAEEVDRALVAQVQVGEVVGDVVVAAGAGVGAEKPTLIYIWLLWNG